MYLLKLKIYNDCGTFVFISFFLKFMAKSEVVG